jgi:hypothetical protein
MPKKSATKSRPSASMKKSKSAGIKDLPMKSRNAGKVVGGGTRAPKDPAPTESLSLNFTKLQTGY